MTLPISRVANVTVSRTSSPATRRGFGVALFLTSQEIVGVLDADNLTRVHGSIDEVEADGFTAADAYHIAATAAFSQTPRPLQIKVGYYDATIAVDEATMIDAISDLADFDSAWYWLDGEAALRDTPMLDGLISWIGTQNKFLNFESNDVLHEDASDTTNVSARHKNTTDRAAIFYHTDASLYPAFAESAALGTYNFDNANTSYTAKFKSLQGITPIAVRSSQVQAITGFTPALGQSVTAGHCANTYVDIGGLNMVVEGSTLTPNTFIDEIHFSDWLQFRTEEEILNVLTQNDVVGMSDIDMQLIAQAVRQVTEIGRASGSIAEDVDQETGDFLESVIINVPSVFDIPESQRQARIAPAIEVLFRYRGAQHYSQINYTITF